MNVEQNGVYPYDGILFSPKKNEVMIHGTTYMNLKNTMVSERSQTQKAKCMIPFI